MSMKRIRQTIQDQSALLLLELLPTTQLIASPLASPLLDIPTLPNLDAFGHYPILQFGIVLIGFIVTVAGLLGWKRGERLGRENAATNATVAAAPVAELHFDGPIRGIFEDLRDIKARQLLARLEIKDDFAVLLSGSRNSVIDKLAALQGDNREVIENCIRDHEATMENRFRDLNSSINVIQVRLNQRIDELMKSLERIEADMAHANPPRRR